MGRWPNRGAGGRPRPEARRLAAAVIVMLSGPACSSQSFSGSSGTAAAKPTKTAAATSIATATAAAPTSTQTATAPATGTDTATPATTLDSSSAASCIKTLSTTGFYDPQRHLLYKLLPQQYGACDGLAACRAINPDARFPLENENASDQILACDQLIAGLWLDDPPPNDIGTFCTNRADGVAPAPAPLALYNFGTATATDPHVPGPILCVIAQ